MLKVLVIGGIGLVLGSLLVMFWAYFMYLWRTWDTKRDPGSMYDAAQAEYDEEFEKVCSITCTVLETKLSLSGTVHK